MRNKLLFYAPIITPRLRYSVEFIFGSMLGLDCRLTDQEQELRSFEGAVVAYHHERCDDVPWFWSQGLLSTSGITEQHIHVTLHGEVSIFFQAPAGKGALLPFDPFAASFFMLSRYEEYLGGDRDEHNRFTAARSLAAQNDFLNKAVVHDWTLMIKEQLQSIYPDLLFKEPAYRFVPTLDIDNAYAYKEKGLLRTVGATVFDLISRQFGQFTDRIKVLAGKMKDPYDSFDFMNEVHREFGVKPIVFWLLGDYGKFDKNISVKNRRFWELIKNVSEKAIAGLHPSYKASVDRKAVSSEKERLEEIVGQSVNISRMHYLRLQLPVTYEQLIASGITEDYSMGFSDASGFRAGVAIPFYFYNLATEEKTNLLIHPFCVMDATLMYYKGLSAELAWQEIRRMIGEVKRVRGCFYPVFHNESLGDKTIWKGWKEVYQKMLKEAGANQL